MYFSFNLCLLFRIKLIKVGWAFKKKIALIVDYWGRLNLEEEWACPRSLPIDDDA